MEAYTAPVCRHTSKIGFKTRREERKGRKKGREEGKGRGGEKAGRENMDFCRNQ